MQAAPKWYEPNPENYDDEAQRAFALIDETAGIEMRQRAWHDLNLWNATLYTNRVLPAFRWGDQEATTELWPENLRTENLIENIGEAMLSKASSSPLKPSLVPHGNSWKVERAVRLMDQFVFGVWRQTESENACVEAFRDAYISNLGCVHVDYCNKALHVRSVFFDNVIVDNRECSDRKMPRTVRIRQVLPRAGIEAEYGVELTAAAYKVNYRAPAEGYAVLVTAYRLPDAKGKGGRFTVACEGKLLIDKAWKEDFYPFVFFHWQDRTSGFFGKGGVEQVVPYQVIANELNDDIRAAQDIACRPRLLVNANSMIDVNQWDNESGRFYLWSGSEPKPFVWPTNLAELYQERERNTSRAYSHMALSEAFANADLPANVRMDSSAGIREFRNMEDAAHLRLWSNFEKFRLAVAKMTIKVLSLASSKDANAYTSVYHPGHSKLPAKSIEFEAVKTLAADQYSWTMEATPLSQVSPAARRELIRDWASRQLGYGDEAKRMLGNSNLEWLEECEMASIDDIRRHIWVMEEGGYEKPENWTNTVAGIPMVTANMHRLKVFDDVEQSVLDAHISWLVAATSIQRQATQPQAPGPSFAPQQAGAGMNAASAMAPIPGA